MITLFYALLGLFLLTQVLDVYTTIKALSIGKTEKNPIMRWVINTFGNVGFIIIKAISSIAIILFCFWLPVFTALLLLWAIDIVYIYIVYNNFKIIRG